MPSIIDRLSPLAPGLILPAYLIARKKKRIALALLIMMALSVSSCFVHFYNTNTVKEIDKNLFLQLQSEDKYFILHSADGAYALKNLKVDNDTLDADLDQVPAEHLKYLNPGTEKTHTFPVKDSYVVLYEVHLYTKDTMTALSSAHVRLPILTLTRVDVYQLNKPLTVSSKVGSIVGITAASVGLVAGVIFLLACNCPQVYADNGNSYEFTGGLYSGALYASLERTDYMPLPALRPAGDKLHLRIGNVEGEEQIINEIKILQVLHDTADQVLLDRHGKALVYRQPLAPETALAGMDGDVRAALLQADRRCYSFTDQSDSAPAADVILDFKKPAGATSGKLVLRAKNSAWSGYLFHEFISLFGSYYPTWEAKKDRSDPKEAAQWPIDQSLPLLVSVKEAGQWKYVDYFATPGNTAERDMIMELDLTGLRDDDHVQVRLQTAYLFWDLDYAGIDYTPDNPCTVTVLNATKIIKQDSSSQTELLREKDDRYAHLRGKEFLEAEFRTNTAGNASWFLMSTGYYHTKKPADYSPRFGELKNFLERGAFDRFSRKKALQWEQGHFGE